MLLAEADAAGQIYWTVSVGSTINRAHQHRRTFSASHDGTNLPASQHDGPKSLLIAGEPGSAARTGNQRSFSLLMASDCHPYDKLALIYRALAVLCTVVVWLRQ